MSSTEVAIPTAFKDVMREKIMSTFLDMIPKEKVDEMVEVEVKAFFETEQLLTIQETTITEANPDYKPSNHSHYHQPKRDVKALVYGSKMTPFRQLVWTTLHCYLAPKLKAMLDEEKTEAVKALDEMLVSNIAPQVKATYKENFNCLANAMSLNMFQTYLKSSITLAHHNMVMSFQQVGINTNSLYAGTPPVADPMTSTPL